MIKFLCDHAMKINKDKDGVPLLRNASRCASRFARSDTSRQLDKLLQH